LRRNVVAEKKPQDETRPEPEATSTDRDVNTRAIVRFGAALAVGLVVVLAALSPFTRWFSQGDAREPAPMPMSTELSRVPPDPRLQPNPRAHLQALRAYEKQRLESYGWVDKNAGVVHIPIERAMDILAEQGLPVRPEGARQPENDITLPTDSSLGAPSGGVKP
jgi:hypothetical protein